MLTIGFVTSEDYPLLTPGDRLIAQAFSHQGISVAPTVWTDRQVDWKTFDYLVIRSCWDYHLQLEAFLQWLEQMAKFKIVVYNPLNVIKENSNKRYLQVLQEGGICMVPSLWYSSGSQPNLIEIMRENQWQEIIIKPNVGATAYQTFKLDLAGAENLNWNAPNLVYPHGFMVQQFRSEIFDNGEWSHMFFGKMYSHSVLKKAKSGDFRVQSNFGGKSRLLSPDEKIIKAAYKVLDCYQEDLLYTRIDGIQIGQKFYLMEVELIEPELFVFDEVVANRFVTAFMSLIN